MGSHKPRGYSVNDFLSWNDRGELILQPKFQRREVWSAKAKSHLIDTILRGLPIPIIFIRQNIDPAKRRTIREVVDGQQRLNAVIAFYRDEISILKSQNTALGGNKYNQLSSEAQQRFLNYEFSVVLLEEVSDADVLQIFARLNTYAQRLTEQELLNAAYFGEFKQTVYTLGYDHLEFWRQNGILQDRQIMRMGEAELTTELLVVMLSGVQHRRTNIRELYAKNDDSFAEKNRITKEFRAVIDAIRQCFGNSLGNTMYSKRVLFHSLFCSFYHVMFGIPSTQGLGRGKIRRQLGAAELVRIKDSLVDLEKKYKSPSPSAEIEDFISACQKSTGDREQRILRIRTVSDYIRKALKK